MNQNADSGSRAKMAAGSLFSGKNRAINGRTGLPLQNVVLRCQGEIQFRYASSITGQIFHLNWTRKRRLDDI